jgi:FAD:protein FMN transferase
MGTIVTIQVRDGGRDPRHKAACHDAVDRAFAWFGRIEASCSRFDTGSEVMQLVERVGVDVPVSPIVYHAVELALAVAEESGGAFDPTIGYAMESRGFNREYRSGATVCTSIACETEVSYRDVRLNPERKTVTILRPLILDLGAVAKGLAVDMAARELQRFRHFAIDAGGDLYLGGRSPRGEPWSVGIRHPRLDRQVLDVIHVSDRAVCTSGDYERTAIDGHHILDPRTGTPAGEVASVTVVAPTAMLADALGTAAFVLGPVEGIRLLERHDVDGLIVTPALERFATRGMHGEYSLGLGAGTAPAVGGGPAILPDA